MQCNRLCGVTGRLSDVQVASVRPHGVSKSFFMARRAIVQSPQPLTAVCGWRAPDLHVSGTSDTYSPWWRSRESGVPVSESVDKGRKELVRRFRASTRRVVDQEAGCLPLIFTRSYSYGTRRRHESPFPPFRSSRCGILEFIHSAITEGLPACFTTDTACTGLLDDNLVYCQRSI